MMRGIDFSTWQTILSTVLGLALITLIGVGVRLLVMFTIQQRRDRENRQINERLRTLIAAYKVLGGSFTGDLSVDPTHLRDLRRHEQPDEGMVLPARNEGSDRSRRIRDAVEAVLSDIILLGTDEQVRLAATAARELAEGRPVHTADLVISLRNFIRDALALDAIPSDLDIPGKVPLAQAPAGAVDADEARASGMAAAAEAVAGWAQPPAASEEWALDSAWPLSRPTTKRPRRNSLGLFRCLHGDDGGAGHSTRRHIPSSFERARHLRLGFMPGLGEAGLLGIEDWRWAERFSANIIDRPTNAPLQRALAVRARKVEVCESHVTGGLDLLRNHQHVSRRLLLGRLRNGRGCTCRQQRDWRQNPCRHHGPAPVRRGQGPQLRSAWLIRRQRMRNLPSASREFGRSYADN